MPVQAGRFGPCPLGQARQGERLHHPTGLECPAAAEGDLADYDPTHTQVRGLKLFARFSRPVERTNRSAQSHIGWRTCRGLITVRSRATTSTVVAGHRGVSAEMSHRHRHEEWVSQITTFLWPGSPRKWLTVQRVWAGQAQIRPPAGIFAAVGAEVVRYGGFWVDSATRVARQRFSHFHGWRSMSTLSGGTCSPSQSCVE
jgi:hypothetical protein